MRFWSLILVVAFRILLLGEVVDHLAAAEPSEERLIMRSGDELSGRSSEIGEGKIRWRLPHGGEVVLPLSEVDRVDFALPTVADKPVEKSREPSVLEMPLESDPASFPDSSDVAAQIRWADAERARLESESLDFEIAAYYERISSGLEEWTQRASLGARYLSGNSNEVFIDLATDFERRTERRLMQINLGGQFGEANGVRGTNRWFANSNTDFDLEGKKWLFFSQIRDRYDEFERLDYRGSSSAGPGYRFYDDDQRRLICRLGPGVTYELYHAPRLQRLTPDAFGEVEARWPLQKRLSAEHKTTMNPSLLDLQLLRITSTSALIWAMDEAEEWSLKLGCLWIYNGSPNEGRLKSDYTATMSVVDVKKAIAAH